MTAGSRSSSNNIGRALTNTLVYLESVGSQLLSIRHTLNFVVARVLFVQLDAGAVDDILPAHQLFVEERLGFGGGLAERLDADAIIRSRIVLSLRMTSISASLNSLRISFGSPRGPNSRCPEFSYGRNRPLRRATSPSGYLRPGWSRPCQGFLPTVV